MYWRLSRFLLPLVVTIVIQEFGVQFVNAGMARMPQATETLAAFGLAWGLILFIASPLGQAKQLSLVLVEDRDSFRKTLRFVLLLGLVLMAAQASLVLTPMGDWVVDDLHQVEGLVSDLARTALLWMVPLPLLRSVVLYYSGILMRRRRTDIVSSATIAGIMVGIATVFLLLPLEAIRDRPIWLPILVTYAINVTELVVVLWGMERFVDLDSLGRRATDARARLSYVYIVRFFWPLALIMFVQDLSRPLINLFVARGPDGTVALAVLTVAYALGQWPYRWLNEIRSLPSAFQEEDPDFSHIRRFTLVCGVISVAISVVLFWTPIRDYVLLTLIGVEPELARRAALPLALYAFFSVIVTIRAYLHGIGLVEHRTKAMAPSAPLRIGAIVLALILLPYVGLTGAALGVASLLAGFAVETLTVWWGVRGRGLIRAWRQAEEEVAF